MRQDVFNQYQINHHHGERAVDTEDTERKIRSKNVVESLKRGKLYDITAKVFIISKLILWKRAHEWIFWNYSCFRLQGVLGLALGNLV